MYDPESKWPATLIAIVCGALALFIVCALAGWFIDPAMPTALRATVVQVWAGLSSVFGVGAIMVRHMT